MKPIRRQRLLLAVTFWLALVSNALPAQIMTMRVSGFCKCEICCGPHACGITASGRPAVGKLIAAPRNFRFGTMIEVPGYGVAPVLDRGGKIKGRRLDLLFASHAAAKKWGVRFLKVKIRKVRNT